jgi:hypothetical protein
MAGKGVVRPSLMGGLEVPVSNRPFQPGRECQQSVPHFHHQIVRNYSERNSSLHTGDCRVKRLIEESQVAGNCAERTADTFREVGYPVVVGIIGEDSRNVDIS